MAIRTRSFLLDFASAAACFRKPPIMATHTNSPAAKCGSTSEEACYRIGMSAPKKLSALAWLIAVFDPATFGAIWMDAKDAEVSGATDSGLGAHAGFRPQPQALSSQSEQDDRLENIQSVGRTRTDA